MNNKILSLKTPEGVEIRFNLYSSEAPETCEALTAILPLDLTLFHARTSGEEIWTSEGPQLNVPAEHATVHIEQGEIGIGPNHARNKIARCLVISYGQAKLFDYANIVGRVVSEDEEKLKEFGNKIWAEGKKTIILSLQNK